MSTNKIRETLTKSSRDAMSLTQAIDFIPGHPHVATVWRWTTKGVRGQRLITTIVGGRRMVTLAAIEEFLQRLNAENGQHEPDEESGFSSRAKQASKVLESLNC